MGELSIAEVLKEERKKHKQLKQLSSNVVFEKIMEKSPPAIITNLNEAINKESERLVKKYNREILLKKDLMDHFHTSAKVIEKLFENSEFPCIYLTEHKKGITPFALTLWSMKRSNLLDYMITAYDEFSQYIKVTK